jgi:hypothetical protein
MIPPTTGDRTRLSRLMSVYFYPSVVSLDLKQFKPFKSFKPFKQCNEFGEQPAF